MSLDDLVLWLQRLVDRFVRWIRLGAPPIPGRRRWLVVQIDGLPRSVLDQVLQERRMPFLQRLLERHHYHLAPQSVGMPTSTPAFQMAAMYGVRPDIPGFHYHDKKRGTDVYFPRAGDAALVESTHARGRVGILQGGSTYGCVFTGGAHDNLFTFATIKRPSGTGLLRALSAFIVLAWVALKCVVLTSVELLQALARLIADPRTGTFQHWKWLALKLGLSVWVRELFTLAVSRDLYRGVPAVYVNYLDYDVLAHAFGPRHRRALRALRRIDRSIHQLWRVTRRVPEHRYDLYILSDHGQARTVPYQSLSGGKSVERVLFEEFFVNATEVSAVAPHRRRIASGIKALRSHRHHGLFQRFLGYLEHDFLARLVEMPEARERSGIRVIAAGPNVFVYFVDADEPLTIERVEERYPRLAEELSRHRGIGFVLARSASGPICAWRGQRYRLSELGDGPFAGRPDLDLVAQGIRDLMEMPSAGDLVLYGNDAPEGNVSFIPELGAHAGPAPDELHTFIVHPPTVTMPSPLTHPIQLYDHFVRYRTGSVMETA